MLVSIDGSIKMSESIYKDSNTGEHVKNTLAKGTVVQIRKQQVFQINRTFRSFARYPRRRRTTLLLLITLAVVLLTSTPLISLIIAKNILDANLNLLDNSISMGALASSISVYVSNMYVAYMHAKGVPLITDSIYQNSLKFLEGSRVVYSQRSFLTGSALVKALSDILESHICIEADELIGEGYTEKCMRSVDYKESFNLPNALDYTEFSYREMQMMIDRNEIGEVENYIKSETFTLMDNAVFYMTVISLHHTEHLVEYLSRNYRSIGLPGYIWGLIWVALGLICWFAYSELWLNRREYEWKEVQSCLLILNDAILLSIPSLQKSLL